MEVTLTLDADLVERARSTAERRQTTLDALVADYLRQVSEREAAVEAYVRRTRQTAGRSAQGWRFRREECYDRTVEA
jgi:hypothetical protein